MVRLIAAGDAMIISWSGLGNDTPTTHMHSYNNIYKRLEGTSEYVYRDSMFVSVMYLSTSMIASEGKLF